MLYKDAARRGYGHAYDDDQVILLSKQRVPQLSSRLIPVQAGDEISLSTYVHYSSAPAKKTWQKIGAAAAGLAIGSLPHLLDRDKANREGSAGNDLLKKAAPLIGAGVAALPFVLNKRKGKAISKNLNMPESKNGWFVPDAYLSYTFYDLEGKVIANEVKSIDKHAKDAWQQLSLGFISPQGGFVQVELGNGSRRPVWMDRFMFNHTEIKPIVPSLLPAKKTKSNFKTVLLEVPEKKYDDKKQAPNARTASTNRRENCRTIKVGPIPGYGGQPYYRTVCDEVPTMWNYNGNANQYLYMQGYVNEHLRWYDSWIRDMMKRYNHPGKKDWNSMSDAKRAEHFLNAIRYVFAIEGGSGVVNLNSFFSNMPLTNGDWTGGTHYVIRINLSTNGGSFPVEIDIPVDPDLRSFQTYYTNGPDIRYGNMFGEHMSQALYHFGYFLKGGTQIGPHMTVPEKYRDEFEEYLYGN